MFTSNTTTLISGLTLDDDVLVRHGGHVGATGRAGAHHDGDLRNALRGHVRLVVEDASKVVAVGEHLVLQRQEGAATVHQVDTGQAVLLCDLLGTQVFLDRDGVVRASLDRSVVGDDHAVDAADAADASDDTARWNIAVHLMTRQCTELQERCAVIHKVVNALSSKQFPSLLVLQSRLLASTLQNFLVSLLEVGYGVSHALRVGFKISVLHQFTIQNISRGHPPLRELAFGNKPRRLTG